jgi:3-deoxy-alpha-D-manno-octulosonate 8-oxidase
MRITKLVGQYLFGRGVLESLHQITDEHAAGDGAFVIYFIDHYFRDQDLVGRLPLRDTDQVVFVDTSHEPATDQVDALTEHVRGMADRLPAMVVGIGGGSALDVAKASSNLLTNGGRAEDYQGWDLVQRPGVFKVGIPTLSGTGAEASRTCVMENHAKKLKLGMNSDHTVFDRLVLDPDLTATVPREQYFYTGTDTYIHCIESLGGRYRHAVADAFSRQALDLCREVFLSDDMQAPDNRERLMVASYLGGSALGNSFVGVVHPFSAGLSMVLGLRHCVSNCIALTALEEFYPREAEELARMAEAQGVTIPRGVCAGLTDAQYRALYEATVVHEKPLANALGDDFGNILTEDKVIDVFRHM